METQTDGKGQTTTFSYNGDSQPITITYSDGTTINYGYDAADNRTSLVDGTGTTTFQYNALNQQTQLTGQHHIAHRAAAYQQVMFHHEAHAI